MDFSTRLLIMLALVASGVAVLDAAISGEWDLLVISSIVTVLLLAVWLRQRASRVDVTLRPDLAHWIERRAQASGEPFDDVLDRSVASFQHGLYADGQHAD